LKNGCRGSNVIYPDRDKKNLKRAASLFWFLLFIPLSVFVVSILIARLSTKHPAPIAERQLTPAVPAPARQCPHSISHQVKRGERLASILQSYAVAPKYGSKLIQALSGAGLLKLYPGDSLVLSFDTSCAPVALSLLSRLTYWYRAQRNDATVTAGRRLLGITVSRGLINGILETSLLEATQRYGLGHYVACKLADIFAWDINFFIDPRAGDTFQIFLSQKYAEGRCIGAGDILAARYTSVNGRDFYAIGLYDDRGTLQYYDVEGRSVQKEFLKAPLRYLRISSGFTYHRLHPILGIVRPHLGIDYAAPAGTPVYAAADGTVRNAGWDNGYGNHIEITHGGAYATCYGHLATISSGIRPGAAVKQGQMIGTVGATGLATGPHLDYRMKRNGSAVNPLSVNLPSKRGISRSRAEQFNRVKESCLALFNFRNPQRPGFYVIDFEQKTPADSVTHPSSPASPFSARGIKSGS
jgi:murein DD-endopeptidase MepM/ murein hydrolase activator NlpD